MKKSINNNINNYQADLDVLEAHIALLRAQMEDRVEQNIHTHTSLAGDEDLINQSSELDELFISRDKLAKLLEQHE